MRLLKTLTDKYYVRGLPAMLFSAAKVFNNGKQVYSDPTGVRLLLDSRNYFQNNIRYGYYENAVRRLIERFVQPGALVLDIGANIGYMTCIAARGAAENGQVISIEPNPSMVSMIATNVQLNNLENVVIQQFAAGESDGKAEFFVGTEPALSTMVKNAGVLQIEKTIMVQLKAVDDIVLECGRQPEEVNFVKIDVEGFEYISLKGMTRIIKARNAVFILENNAPVQRKLGVNFQKLVSENFLPYGYSIYWIDSKENRGLVRRKTLKLTKVTAENIESFNDQNGDFLVSPNEI